MARQLRLSNRVVRSIILAGVLWLLSAFPAKSAVVCFAPPPPLSHQFAQAESVALVKLLETHPGQGDNPGSSTYEIVEILRDTKKTLKVGTKLTRPERVLRQPGMLAFAWKFPHSASRGSDERIEETTVELVKYLRNAPPPNRDDPKRLEHFAKFLEDPDVDIAADAYHECSIASATDVIRVARKFPPEKLRAWLFGKSQAPRTTIRGGLYATMLGWCGDRSDIEPLRSYIVAPLKDDDFRIGTEGYITAYLMLAGYRGLPEIEQFKLMAKESPFSERYAAIQAVRYLYQHGEGRIPQARLRQCMHKLVDQPDLAEIAIIDLARWKDWELQTRILKLYGSGGEFNGRRVKKAMINYMLVSVFDVPANQTDSKDRAELPPHVRFGHEALKKMREQDPKLVADTEIFHLRMQANRPKSPN